MKASLTKAEMKEMGRKWHTAWCLPGALRETRRDADTALGSAFSLSLYHSSRNFPVMFVLECEGKELRMKCSLFL